MRQTRSQTRTKSIADTSANRSIEYNELKALIDTFSNTELGNLLGVQIVNSQVATVLRRRALLLLDTSFPLTRRKIREIQSKRKVTIQSPIPQMYHHHHQQGVNMVLTQQQGNSATNPPNGTNNGVVVFTQAQAVPKKLAFFEVMGTLMKPTNMISTHAQRVQEASYYFQLNATQAHEVAINRDVRNPTKPDYSIQIQLRFCSIDNTPTGDQQDDYFPPNIVVKVNNKMVPLPNPIPTNKPNTEAKRPPRPVNITPNCKLSPIATNHISVTWCADFNKHFFVSVYLVKKLSSAQLLSGMRTAQRILSSDATRALIKEKLKEDADCEIAATTVNVSLVCPLGKMKMRTPCRSTSCTHFQCFDAETYLQMNEKKPTWNCPVCDKPAPYDKLVVDAYFQEVLTAADTNSIQLNKDGSWCPQKPGNDVLSLDTPHKKYQSVDISDDTEVITDSPRISSFSSRLREPTITTTTLVPEVDLTLSDSDDDVPDVPVKRIQPPPKLLLANPTTATAAPRTNDMSIISLDSPTPPSSPVNNMSPNSFDTPPPSHLINSNSGVSSTTHNNWNATLNSLSNNRNVLNRNVSDLSRYLQPFSSPLLQDPLGGVYNDFYHQRQLLQNNSPLYPYPTTDDENRY